METHEGMLIETPPSWEEVRHGKRVLKEDQVFSVALKGLSYEIDFENVDEN